MSNTVKIILAAVAVVFLVGLGTCGAGYYWVMQNKDSFIAEAKQIGEEATAFAKTSDQEGCLKETLRRINTCEGGDMGGAVCRGKRGAFMGICLEHATPTAGFCDGVPKQMEILKNVEWATSRCQGLEGTVTQHCTQQISKVAAYCERAAGTDRTTGPPGAESAAQKKGPGE